MDPPHSTGATFIKSCDAAETTLSLPNFKAPFFLIFFNFLCVWDPSPVPSTPILQIGGSLPFSFSYIHLYNKAAYDFSIKIYNPLFDIDIFPLCSIPIPSSHACTPTLTKLKKLKIKKLFFFNFFV